ncbi:hypothetical protein [Oceanicoccus sp. KOV_DT_Chl]|uniref:hypothetical protein n=1 Tax=Oceanicoccus sp. KOV_DT_Chl TaxID=1904639 RepID=UPI000C7D2E48|nr:hypothetical protein [Oceanicoccus sp. KOV_DT_Chl]
MRVGPERQQNIKAGWDYESTNHKYHASNFNWSPGFSSSSNNRSWEAQLSAEFTAPTTGRYCFSKDNGTTGTAIVPGWNSCSSTWINKQRITEVGYGASWKPVGCVDLNAGQTYRLDLYSRHHNANVSRSFISKPRYCFGGDADCTPDIPIQQRDVRAISDTNNR